MAANIGFPVDKTTKVLRRKFGDNNYLSTGYITLLVFVSSIKFIC